MAFLEEKVSSRALQKTPRLFDFSAVSANSSQGSPLPGLKGLVRVPVEPANHPVEALCLGVRLQLTAGGASRMRIMIAGRLDPAGDGRRVGRVWPRPRVLSSMSLKSRPQSGCFLAPCCPSRATISADWVTEALLRGVGSPFLSIAYPKFGSSTAAVVPRRGIGGADVAGGVPAPSPSSKNEPAQTSGTLLWAPGGPLAGAWRSATPPGSATAPDARRRPSGLASATAHGTWTLAG